ncbi:flavoprotein [Dactylosporangium maewongense]|uniref:Flavoprotein n=1 Tax=Dactylosporangium maewongense TaxID=634393 RepID=A0ABN2CU02_9ACTN
MTERRQLSAHLVVCAAPPVQHVTELVTLLRADGWAVQLTVTPTAATWIDTTMISQIVGGLVRVAQRSPDEPRDTRRADVVVVVPATFNTINKWAAGINDNAALAVLQSALGEATPILACPYAKKTLTSHPAYHANVQLLQQCGVRFAELRQQAPASTPHLYNWADVAAAMTAAATRA